MKINRHSELLNVIQQVRKIQNEIRAQSGQIIEQKGRVATYRSSLTEVLPNSDEEIQSELRAIETSSNRFE